MKIEIVKSGINGEGIGYADKKPVFIRECLEGELVDASITEKNKTYSTAKLERVIRKSKHRLVPKCKEYKQCKSCSCMIADYTMQKRMKEELLRQSLIKYAAIDPNVIEPIIESENQFYYRNSCKVPLSMNHHKLVSGMYQPNSNYFVEINNCIIHDKDVERIRKEVINILNKYHQKAFDFKTKKGFRTLVIRKLLNHAQVTLVTGEDKINQACIDEIMQIDMVSSLWQSIHIQKKTPEIFGNRMICLSEKKYLDFEINGVRIKLSPRSFFQLNTLQAEKLYQRIQKEAGYHDFVVEAYSGIGGISFTLKDQMKKIIGIESIKDAVNNANKAAKENGLDHIQFICDDAATRLKMISKKQKIDLLIVDPPRSGLDEAMIQTILKSKIDRVLYVSCNTATLGKNLAELKQKYRVEKVIPFDMFPQTAHVETVVLLSHKKSDGHINVKVEFGEGEGKVPLDNIAKRAEEYKPKERVTYKMIKEYIEAKYGFKVHTAYIAEVKRDLGLPMYDAPNAVEELKQPRKHPTAEKVEAIKDALKHFEVI